MSSEMAKGQQKNISNSGRVPSFSKPFSPSVDGGKASMMNPSDGDDVPPERVDAFSAASLKTETLPQKIKNQMSSAFECAFAVASRAIDDIKPVFLEAAGLVKSVAAKWHGRAPIGLPGAKFHAMTGQAEGSHLVRMARQNARAFRNMVMGRPDYYAGFEKINSLKM